MRFHEINEDLGHILEPLIGVEDLGNGLHQAPGEGGAAEFRVHCHRFHAPRGHNPLRVPCLYLLFPVCRNSSIRVIMASLLPYGKIRKNLYILELILIVFKIRFNFIFIICMDE